MRVFASREEFLFFRSILVHRFAAESHHILVDPHGSRRCRARARRAARNAPVPSSLGRSRLNGAVEMVTVIGCAPIGHLGSFGRSVSDFFFRNILEIPVRPVVGTASGKVSGGIVVSQLIHLPRVVGHLVFSVIEEIHPRCAADRLESRYGSALLGLNERLREFRHEDRGQDPDDRDDDEEFDERETGFTVSAKRARAPSPRARASRNRLDHIVTFFLC